MKLFLYDEKHQQLIDNLDLGNLSNEEIAQINKIIDFLEDNHILDRYKNLTLANKAEVQYEDGEPSLNFSDADLRYQRFRPL